MKDRSNPDREKVTELYYSETKQFNASCIDLFQELDKKATFFISIAFAMSVTAGSVIVYAFTNQYFVLCTSAGIIFILLLYVLNLLVAVLKPTDISRQGDRPAILRQNVDDHEGYVTGLINMIDVYNAKIELNDASTSHKAIKLRSAVLILVFVPYIFALVYVALKAPGLMAAFHGFVAVPL